MWFKIRVLGIVLSVIVGMGSSHFKKAPAFILPKEFLAEPVWLVLQILILLLVLAGPLLFVPLILWVQARNPVSSPVWTLPNWNSNFLNFQDPVHFFHFGAVLGFVYGLGYFGDAFVIFDKLKMAAGACVIASSISLFLGVKASMRLFATKYQKIM